jgi:hypothetical protein
MMRAMMIRASSARVMRESVGSAYFQGKEMGNAAIVMNYGSAMPVFGPCRSETRAASPPRSRTGATPPGGRFWTGKCPDFFAWSRLYDATILLNKRLAFWSRRDWEGVMEDEFDPASDYDYDYWRSWHNILGVVIILAIVVLISQW